MYSSAIDGEAYYNNVRQSLAREREYDAESDSRSGRSTPDKQHPISGRPEDKSLYNIPTRNIKSEKTHLFMVRTFSEPTQCAICCCYMLGLWRQGVICQECELPCHIHCAKTADQQCPIPFNIKTRIGLDTINYPQEQV